MILDPKFDRRLVALVLAAAIVLLWLLNSCVMRWHGQDVLEVDPSFSWDARHVEHGITNRPTP